MKRLAPFISRVRLKNYKSIAQCDVRLRPLTVLTGPNGSGKSNFLQSLALLARAVRTTPHEAITELGGLAEILRRVPRPAESFSIDVEAAVPRGSEGQQRAAVSYGFEIGAARSHGLRPFEVLRETCEVRQGGRGWRFDAERGAVRDEALGQPVFGIEPDRLYLPVAGVQATFAPLLAGLAGTRFYSFALDALRDPSRASEGAILGDRGEHLGAVLSALAAAQPDLKSRLGAYLHTIAPGIEDIEARSAGGYMTVAFRASNSALKAQTEFGPDAISDGTIRAAAVLAALFQPAAADGRIPLIGIDNPETTLHPAAAGVLLDALAEASEHVQVIMTTTSADLLDREEADVSVVRVAGMDDGLTVVGEVDRASRQIVRDRLYTLGELMRAGQLSPEPEPGPQAASPEA